MITPALLGVTASQRQRDPYIANVKLLLLFAGSNGSTSIIDSSPSPATCTAVNGAALSTARAIPGASSSLFLDGTNDNVTTNRVNNTIGTEYTMEAFVRNTAAQRSLIADSQVLASPNAYFIFAVEPDGRLGHYLRNSSGAGSFALTTAAGLVPMDDSVFTHVAVTRDASNLITLWVNGVSSATDTSSTSSSGPGTWNIGSQFGSFDFFKGYNGGLRLTEGVCRYTADFTPPTRFPTS